MPTPAWVAPINNNGVNVVADIQQLLGVHGITPVFGSANGVPNMQTLGSFLPAQAGLGGQQSLAGFQVDQPFTMTGTTIGRIELPLSAINGVGQDITVGLYANAAGNPTGSAIAQTTIPAEFLAGASLGTTMPMGDGWGPQTNLELPFPYNSNLLQGSGTDGISAVAVGGFNGPSVVATVLTAPIQTNSVGTWAKQPDIPAGVYAPCVVCSGGFLYVLGGLTTLVPAASTATYSASLGADGSVGAWTAQAVLPAGTGFGSAVVVGTKVYVAGGQSSGVLTSAVYSATLNADGTIGAWSAETSLPRALSGGKMIYINGWLLYTGGTDGTVVRPEVWGAYVAGGTSIQAWVPFPNLPSPITSHSAVAAGNVAWVGAGGTTTGGALNPNVYALEVYGETSVGRSWQIGPVNNAATGPGFNYTPAFLSRSTPPYWLVTGAAGASGVSMGLYANTMISIPLIASGLTNAATYHIVIGGVGGTQYINDSGVPWIYGISGAGAFAGQLKTGAGPWTPYIPIIGAGIQMNIYNTSFTGQTKIVNTAEDTVSGVPTRWTWLNYDRAGKLVSFGEYNGTMRSYRTIQYDASGLPVSVT